MIALVASATLAFSSLAAQDTEEFREFEDSLVVLSQVIFAGSCEAEKYEANALFLELLQDALSLNNSFRYPFDSLQTVSILTSPDNRVRIFTWMIARDNGTYEYFGLVQSYSRRDQDYVVYELTDMSNEIETPETRVLDHKTWFGAVYYDIIQTRSGQQRFYTLLGWDGHDPLIRRRIIEVLTLRSNGMPRFGHNLFRYEHPQQRRILFEYSAMANMTLRYERQSFHETRDRLFTLRRRSGGGSQPGFFERLRYALTPGNPDLRPRRDRSNRYVRRSDDMIIFDNLVPLDHTLKGHRQFYVPEGNIVNGFRFHRGRWRLVEDIDARNAPHRYDRPSRRPTPEIMTPRRN